MSICQYKKEESDKIYIQCIVSFPVVEQSNERSSLRRDFELTTFLPVEKVYIPKIIEDLCSEINKVVDSVKSKYSQMSKST